MVKAATALDPPLVFFFFFFFFLPLFFFFFFFLLPPAWLAARSWLPACVRSSRKGCYISGKRRGGAVGYTTNIPLCQLGTHQSRQRGGRLDLIRPKPRRQPTPPRSSRHTSLRVRGAGSDAEVALVGGNTRLEPLARLELHHAADFVPRHSRRLKRVGVRPKRPRSRTH